MRVASPSITWKETNLLDEFWQIDERLQFILEDCARWVVANGYKFVVTDLLSEASEDKKLNRISTAHQEGRAADIRTRDWPEEFVKKFLTFIEAAHGHHGAISKKDGKRRVAVYHNNGNGIHFHIQISRRT